MTSESTLGWISYIITSVGNFSIQYNFQAISVALLVMSASLCTSNDDDCKQGTQAAWVKGTASAVVFVGAGVGQLSMGYLGDIIGRTKALKLTLSLACVSAALSAAAPNDSATTVYSLVIVFRFFLGVGVGGVYPLAATKAAEDGGGSEGKGLNSITSALAFFWQAPGTMFPWLVALSFSRSDMTADQKWRLLLGLGAVPAFFVVVGTIIEQTLKTENIPSKQSSSVTQSDGTVIEMTVWDHLKDPVNVRKLAVSGGGWFLYDVCFYGMELFGGEIVDEIDGDHDNISSDASISDKAWHNSLAFGLGIPACLLTIWLMQKGHSLKSLQIYGFLMIAAFFILMACLFDVLKDENPDALFAVYCFLLFSLSFGPNTTTFVLPATMYPREIRSTFNGISAACGKLGAVVGAYLFPSMSLVVSYPPIMVICALVAIAGAALTHFYLDEEDPINQVKRAAPKDIEEDSPGKGLLN